jgi:hypothetical protein
MSYAVMANQPVHGTVDLSPVNSLSKSTSVLKHSHLMLQAGGYWSTQGKTQHINIDGLIGDQFTADHRNGSNGLVGLGYYLDGQNLDQIQFSYGINFFYLPQTSISGTVIQEDLFSNLSYRYRVKHYPLYASAKATTSLPVSNLSLTLDAGIGPNFMRTSEFVERSLDGGITLPDNAFSGHTSTTFSATAGIGLQLAQVLGGMPLECGYRFFYLGQGKLARNTNQLLNTLHTGTAYANAVLCSVRI